MIVTIGGIKGGSGKTTIATNFAIMRALAGKDVLLVDADDQRTATDFSAMRADEVGKVDYTAIQLFGSSVRQQVVTMKDKYDDIIIDAGGRDTTSQRAALTISDKVIFPFIPRSFDLWTLEQVSNLNEECKLVNPKLKAITFLNKADSSGKDNEESASLLKEVDSLTYLDTPIKQRKAFSNASSCGLSIIEYKPRDSKAIGEIKTFFRHIFDV